MQIVPGLFFRFLTSDVKRAVCDANLELIAGESSHGQGDPQTLRALCVRGQGFNVVGRIAAFG